MGREPSAADAQAELQAQAVVARLLPDLRAALEEERRVFRDEFRQLLEDERQQRQEDRRLVEDGFAPGSSNWSALRALVRDQVRAWMQPRSREPVDVRLQSTGDIGVSVSSPTPIGVTTMSWVTVAVVVLAIAAVAHEFQRADKDIYLMPLSVPRELADRGVTGDVAARRIADQMTRMFETTDFQDATPEVSEARADVEVPGSNVSIRTLARYLRELNGFETHTITGEITYLAEGQCQGSGETSDGRRLELVLRSRRGVFVPACELVEPEARFNDLLVRGGEYAARLPRPYLLAWHVYQWEWPGYQLDPSLRPFANTLEQLKVVERTNAEPQPFKITALRAKVSADLGMVEEARTGFRTAENQLPSKDTLRDDHQVADSAETFFSWWLYTELEQGAYQPAVELYSNAAEHGLEASYGVWVSALERLGRDQEVERIFAAARRWGAPARDLYHEWARHLEGRGMYREAADKFVELVDSTTSQLAFQDFARHAHFSLRAERLDEAQYACESGLNRYQSLHREARDRRKNDLAELLKTCGQVHARQGQHETAIRFFEQSNEAANHAYASADMGLSYAALGKEHHALEACNERRNGREDLSDPFLVCAAALAWREGRYAEAGIALEQVRAPGKDKSTVLDLRWQIAKKTGDVRKAIAGLAEAVATNANQGQDIDYRHVIRGRLNYFLGEFEEARDDFDRFLSSGTRSEESGSLAANAMLWKFLAEQSAGGDAAKNLREALKARAVTCGSEPTETHWPMPVVCFLSGAGGLTEERILAEVRQLDVPNRYGRVQDIFFFLSQNALTRSGCWPTAHRGSAYPSSCEAATRQLRKAMLLQELLGVEEWVKTQLSHLDQALK
jgi:tetratricopeptide (TPR) repeat protein